MPLVSSALQAESLPASDTTEARLLAQMCKWEASGCLAELAMGVEELNTLWCGNHQAGGWWALGSVWQVYEQESGFLLESSWLIMLCEFQVSSKVNQLYMQAYI